MALNNMGLGFMFTARNLATGTINKLKRQLAGVSNQSRLTGLAMKAGFAMAAGGVTNLLIGLGVLGTAITAANIAGNFEQQMSLIGALSGATGERLERLRDAAIEAGLATRFSPDEAVEGLRNLITASLSAEQAAEALTPALQVATFGMIDVADASSAIISAMVPFRSEGLSTQQIADRLATVMARTNFQAQDFAYGLSAVTAQAGIAGQTLDSTLVSMGLLRNMNIGASRSATALREAIRRLSSDQRAQATATRLLGESGIYSEGGQGRMRNIIEIIHDLDMATRELTEAERNRNIAAILGTKGIQLFKAVQGAEYRKRLQDGTTLILEGVDAARELERQMRESAGVADMLQRAVSEGNYAGVVNVLKGVALTFMVEIGRPIGEVLVPVIVLFRDALTGLTRFIRDLPGPIKRFGAALFLSGGFLATVSGIVGLLVAGFVLLIPVIKTVAIVIGGLIIAMAPFVVMTGLMIGAIVIFREAFVGNIGGITTFMQKSWEKIKLFFSAIVQLFSRGGFSGAVREEMGKAENQGIRRFVINIFRIGSRIMVFLGAIRTGFVRILDTLSPKFQMVIKALEDLFKALGFVSDGAKGLADTKMDTWAETGARVGAALGDVLGYIVDGITWTIETGTNLVNYFKKAWGQVSPFFTQFMGQISEMGRQFESMFVELGIKTDSGKDSIGSFGKVAVASIRVVLFTIIGLSYAITWLVTKITQLVRIINRAKAYITDAFTILSIRVKTIFANIADSILNTIDKIMVVIGRILAKVPSVLRFPGAGTLISLGEAAEERVTTREAAMAERTRTGRAAEIREGTVNIRAFEAEAAGRAQQRDDQIAQMVTDLRAERAIDRTRAQQPINIILDGERVGALLSEGDRREGALSFVPVGAGS
jgi:TP901 family phage tail tape measure protein